VLFVAARLRLSRGDAAPGAIAFAYRNDVPRVADVLLLRPRYLPTSAMGRGPPVLQALIERQLGAALGLEPAEIYPLSYEARVPIGGGFELRGTVTAGGKS